MNARGQTGERRWGRAPTAVTVKQEPMRSPQPWDAVLERLREAILNGELAARSRAARADCAWREGAGQPKTGV